MICSKSWLCLEECGVHVLSLLDSIMLEVVGYVLFLLHLPG